MIKAGGPLSKPQSLVAQDSSFSKVHTRGSTAFAALLPGTSRVPCLLELPVRSVYRSAAEAVSYTTLPGDGQANIVAAVAPATPGVRGLPREVFRMQIVVGRPRRGIRMTAVAYAGLAVGVVVEVELVLSVLRVLAAGAGASAAEHRPRGELIEGEQHVVDHRVPDRPALKGQVV
jgi:hypothetical protein